MRILSLFNTRLNDISDFTLRQVKEQCFDAVQISPLQETKEENNDVYWMLYQPINFKIGNRIATRDDLIDFCNRCHYHGLNVIVDAVINNMAEGAHLVPHDKVDYDLKYCYDAWRHAPEIKGDEWNDRYKVTHYNLGLPSLNHSNHLVQDKVIEYLNDLIACGVDGFRFDAAKSIPLPEEGCDFLGFFPCIYNFQLNGNSVNRTTARLALKRLASSSCTVVSCIQLMYIMHNEKRNYI